jgi:hypothetical protein
MIAHRFARRAFLAACLATVLISSLLVGCGPGAGSGSATAAKHSGPPRPGNGAASGIGHTTVVKDDSPELKKGYMTVSPDGKFTARLVEDYLDPAITITERATGKSSRIQEFLSSPVFAMVWTAKSDGLIVAGHIAHGVQIQAITRGSKGWEIQEPEIDTAYLGMIVPLEITPKGDGVHFRYGTTDHFDSDENRHKDSDDFVTSYTYDVITRRSSHESSRLIPPSERRRKMQEAEAARNK